MFRRGGHHRTAQRWLMGVIALILALTAIPVQSDPAAAQGVATITVTSLDGDGVTAVPFARFQAVSSNGIVYGPLETGLDGTVSFAVDTVGGTATYSIVEETPVACGIPPEPVDVGPLTDGESVAVDVVTETDPNCNLGTLAAYRYICPEGFDTSAADYATWVNGCTQTVDGVNFTFQSLNDGQSFTTPTGAYGISGRAPLVGLSPGDYLMFETNQPQDQTGPFVFCLSYATPNYATSSAPDSVYQADVVDGAVTVNLSGNRVSCDFFMVPGLQEQEIVQAGDEQTGETPQEEPTSEEVVAADSTTTTLELHKLACEPGYEPAGGAIFDDCHDNGVAGVTFTVEGSGGFFGQQVTSLPTSPGPGVTVFSDLPTDSYVITEDVPGDSGSIYVYCSVADSDLVVPFEYTEQDGIAIDLQAGVPVLCDWYNIPDVQQTNTGSIELHKSVCEPGYVPGGTIFADCHDEGVAGVTFTVEGPNGYFNEQTTTLPATPGPGVALFSSLEPGDYAIYEDVPGDTGSIFVDCYLDDLVADVPVTYTEFDGVVINLSQGAQVYCDWYNIPDDQQVEPPALGSLEMHKSVCEPGYEPGPNIFNDCHDDGVAGVVFTVEGPGGYFEEIATTIPNEPGPGVALFEGLQPGAYTVTESVPGDTGSIFVYCSLEGQETEVPFVYTEFDGIQFDLAPGAQVVCDWYNIPDVQVSASVEVIKTTCPIGFSPEGKGYIDFATACTSLTDDVDFWLTPEGGDTIVATTGSAGPGTVRFSDLTVGTYELFEDIPLEFVTPFAFCGTVGEQPAPQPLDGALTFVELQSADEALICSWFNVPEDHSGRTGSVTFTKFLCPPGTTTNYWENCSGSPLAGATFDNSGPDGIAGSQVTGADGKAIFTDLPAGNYSFQEIPPAGTNVAVYVVSCFEGETPYPFNYNDSNGMRIEIQLDPGAHVACNWFNIPPSPRTPTPTPGDQGGSITVHKLLCTGKSRSEYNWERDCQPDTGGAGFKLETAGGAPVATGSANPQGILTFTGLKNGAYSLDETTGDWCYAEADRVDAGGNVLVSNGGNTDVFIYNCSTSRVRTLPSTGVGSSGGAAGLPWVPAGLGAIAFFFAVTLPISAQRSREALFRPCSVDAPEPTQWQRSCRRLIEASLQDWFTRQ